MMSTNLISRNLTTSATIGATLCLLSLTTGCGSTPVDLMPYCAADKGVLCEPAGFPYATAIGSRSDACPTLAGMSCDKPMSKTTATVSNPETGKVCMKGTVAGREGFAWLIVKFDEWNKEMYHIVSVLDADALGIDQLSFKVDTPPMAGITVFATTAHKFQCFGGPPECYDGWDLMTGARTNVVRVISDPGVISAPFANFAGQDPNQSFDTKHLGDFIFILGAGDYDFCVSDFKFLDANGNQVTPGGTIDGGTADTSSSDTASEAASTDGGASDDGASDGG
jgi:hypothetical protein